MLSLSFVHPKMAESLTAFGFGSWSKCVTVYLDSGDVARLRSRGLGGRLCLGACGVSAPLVPGSQCLLARQGPWANCAARIPTICHLFPKCVTGTLSRGFSRLQRTRKVQTRMHVACFGGPRLADSQIQSKNKPTHHFGPCFLKKKKN